MLCLLIKLVCFLYSVYILWFELIDYFFEYLIFELLIYIFFYGYSGYKILLIFGKKVCM